jgi:hypothetical protein
MVTYSVQIKISDRWMTLDSAKDLKSQDELSAALDRAFAEFGQERVRSQSNWEGKKNR